MPAFPKYELTNVLVQALNEGDCRAVRLVQNNANPRRMFVGIGAQTLKAYVYIWTLTPGGRPSLPFEYRVQMTGVASPLAENPDGPTLIIGYEPSLRIFAGFDARRHRVFTTGSPSVQIDIRTVRSAITDGMSLDVKENGEIACGIRPDHLPAYLIKADEIHHYGTPGVKLLKDAAEGKVVNAAAVSRLSVPRKKTVQEVSRWSRDANFRHQVVQAYENRCCVTGIQLKLVDAAHILPVGAPGSTDDVTNGIALSPTYHRAFDQGLICLTDSLRFRLNQGKADRLVSLDLGAGLPDFVASLDHPIILPSNAVMRPSVEFIRRGNKYRQEA